MIEVKEHPKIIVRICAKSDKYTTRRGLLSCSLCDERFMGLCALCLSAGSTVTPPHLFLRALLSLSAVPDDQGNPAFSALVPNCLQTGELGSTPNKHNKSNKK